MDGNNMVDVTFWIAVGEDDEDGQAQIKVDEEKENVLDDIYGAVDVYEVSVKLPRAKARKLVLGTVPARQGEPLQVAVKVA